MTFHIFLRYYNIQIYTQVEWLNERYKSEFTYRWHIRLYKLQNIQKQLEANTQG